MWLRISLSVLAIGLTWAETLKFDESFNRAWSVLSGRMHQTTCVEIPKNMSLCHKIGYSQMRLPNLLEHDNLAEATSQAANWNALLGIRCHPYTQIFLCSLFSPVCLERVVYPCRSLCEGVQRGCETYMKKYGFPWPDMFKCDQFPTDDNLCIPAPTNDIQQNDRICKPCKEPDTYEGILHTYCQETTNFVVRAKVRGLHKRSDTADPGEVEIDMGKGKKKFYKKASKPKKLYKDLAESDAKIYISQAIGCSCDQRILPGEHHLMGIRVEQKYGRGGEQITKFYAEFITPWKDVESDGGTKLGIKKALRAIRKGEDQDLCNGGNILTHLSENDKDFNDDDRMEERKVRRNRRREDRTLDE